MFGHIPSYFFSSAGKHEVNVQILTIKLRDCKYPRYLIMVSFNAIFIVDIVFESSGNSIIIKVRNSEVGTRAFATDASKSEILT